MTTMFFIAFAIARFLVQFFARFAACFCRAFTRSGGRFFHDVLSLSRFLQYRIAAKSSRKQAKKKGDRAICRLFPDSQPLTGQTFHVCQQQTLFIP
jgi:hypothetical protein